MAAAVLGHLFQGCFSRQGTCPECRRRGCTSFLSQQIAKPKSPVCKGTATAQLPRRCSSSPSGCSGVRSPRVREVQVPEVWMFGAPPGHSAALQLRAALLAPPGQRGNQSGLGWRRAELFWPGESWGPGPSCLPQPQHPPCEWVLRAGKTARPQNTPGSQSSSEVRGQLGWLEKGEFQGYL